METANDDVLSLAERQELGQRIDRLRRAQRLSLAELATKAGYDERTARNVIQGQKTRYKTLMHFCESVGIPNIHAQTDVTEFADESRGGYTKKSFQSYIGHYEACRWSYDQTGNILRSFFEIRWEKGGLRFIENQRYREKSGKLIDFSQSGDVYANEEAGLIHLMTIVEGMVRLVTLTRLQPEGILKGAVLSQARLAFYRRPAVSPLYLQKLERAPTSETFDAEIGEVSPEDSGYDQAAAELRSIEREVLLSTVGLDLPRIRGRRSESGTVTRLPIGR